MATSGELARLIVEGELRTEERIDHLRRHIDGLFCVLERKIMATMQELQASMDAVGDQLTKAAAEISAEIQRLTDAIAAAGGTTPEVDASLTRLQGLAQSLDDLNPDAPPPAPPAEG